ncbi:MAG TPA: response regulator [Nitrososphaeraceae archaeon]
MYKAKRKKNILSQDAVCNIMVVDDDDNILLAIKNGLEEKGFKIHIFKTVESALDAFENHPRDYYDLVLTDIYMPNMNGFALYLCLKEKNSSLKIVFMTAFDIAVEEFKAVVPSVELNDVIKKPFSISDLATRIRYILIS